ncbi:hypothetical protein [Streptomyces sp. KL116D]
MGRAAVELLVAQIQGSRCRPASCSSSPRLLVRGATAPPASG